MKLNLAGDYQRVDEARWPTADAALRVGAELHYGSVGAGQRYLAFAAREAGSVPPERRGHFHVLLAAVRLFHARQSGDFAGVVEEAQRLLAPVGTQDASGPGLGEDLRVLALMNLGIAELWTARSEAAGRHLSQAVSLARRNGRPLIEIAALGHLAMISNFESAAPAVQQSMAAVDLARAHGWGKHPIVVHAYLVLAWSHLWPGRLEVDTAEREAGEARTALAALRLAQGDPRAAAAALAPVLDGSAHLLNPRVWTVYAFLLEAIARDALGEPAAAGQALERSLDHAERAECSCPSSSIQPWTCSSATSAHVPRTRHCSSTSWTCCASRN